MTDRAVSNWERGQNYPDISMLEKIADILGVSVIELLKGQRLTFEDNSSKVQSETFVNDALDYAKIILSKQKRRLILRMIILVIVAFAIFVFALTKRENYTLIEKSSYSDSLLKFYNTETAQSVEQRYFITKLIHLYSYNREDQTYYFYEILIAPKMNKKLDHLTIQILPDYGIDSRLDTYFNDRSGRFWLVYDVRPSTIIEPLKNISYHGVVGEKFGTIIIQGYMSDGGSLSLNTLDLTKSVIQKSIEQMIVKVKSDYSEEIFHFAANNKTISLNNEDLQRLGDSNPVIKTFIKGGLTFYYGEFK